MTNSPFGRIDFDGLLSDLLGGEGGFPGMFTSTTVTTETPVSKATHKKVSDLSVGTVVVNATGEEAKIVNICLVEDGVAELTFDNRDVVEVWLNAMLEVK